MLLRVGANGLRGQVGNGLTPASAVRYAAALGTYLDGGLVAVATDSRYSSPMLRHAVLSALLSSGCEVLDCGMVPAPVLAFTVRRLQLAGGLLIGATHHPAGWNALVPFQARGAVFSQVQAQSLLDIYHSQQFRRCQYDRIGKITPAPADTEQAYLESLLTHLDVAAIRRAKFTVVADFCNGTGAQLVTSMAERLGVRLVAINERPHGFLPHDPEPRPRSSAQVQALIAPLKAHVGMVFNSDLSRLALVTDTGETLSEEYSFPVLARHLLPRLPAPRLVVTNYCTTRTLDDVVKAAGGTVDKARTGQAYIVDRMQELHAGLGGEGCGSMSLNGFLPTYDACLMMGLTLESLAHTQQPLSSAIASLPRYHIVKRKITVNGGRAYGLIHTLAGHFPELPHNDSDGLRLDWPEGWAHLRMASTEPAIRLIVEWQTRAGALAQCEKILSLLEPELA